MHDALNKCSLISSIIIIINPRLPKGVVTTPKDVFSLLKRCNQDVAANCRIILSGHFGDFFFLLPYPGLGVG